MLANRKENNNKSETPKSLFLLKELVQRGTFIDKITSLCSLIKNKPSETPQYLDQLIILCSGKKRRETYLAIEKTKNIIIEIFETKINIDENILKNQHLKLIQSIKTIINDPLYKIRLKMIGFLTDLLKNTKYNKQTIINIIINKFCDPDNQVSAHAHNLLHSYLYNNIQDYSIVIGEICSFLSRPNLSFKPRYASICFLNQIVLNSHQFEIANMLVGIYLNLFNTFNFEQDTKSKMSQALLTGINRAMPYTKNMSQYGIANIEKLIKMACGTNFLAAIRALIVLFHIKDDKPSLRDRFYITLYNLLFRNFTTLENHTIMLFFNLIYKSLIDDNDSERKRAIVKRLLQVCIHQTPEFECSCLLLLSELYPEKSDLIQLFSFEKPDEKELQKSNALTKNSTSWDFKNLHSKIDLFTTYNWKHPDPKTCNSSSTDIWEIVLFDRHYHASVRPFIKNFLNGELKYGGDPLVDFTHTSFIDRFIRREAKIKTTTSIHQRKITTDKSIKPINEIMQNDTSTLLPEENLIQQYYKNNKKAVKKRRKRSEEISTDDESDFSHLSTFGKNSKVKCEKKPRTGSNT